MNFLPKDIQEEINIVERYIADSIKSSQQLIQQSTNELLKAGGKRFRPALVLIAGKFGPGPYDKLIPVAAAVETIHMATLIHDDIIDESKLRRGIPTIQHKWGKDTAVFTGDFLLSKAFDILVKEAPPHLLPVVSQVMIKICEGEVDQYESRYNTDVSETQYLNRINKKTALLFALSCELGAGVSRCQPETTRALKEFGLCLGMAFQITDDVLDLSSDKQKLGKPTYKDIIEGVYTLPLIYALKSSAGKQLKTLLDTGNLSDEDLYKIVNIVKQTGGLNYALDVAEHYLQKAKTAIASLPDNQYRRTLSKVLDKMLSRKY